MKAEELAGLLPSHSLLAACTRDELDDLVQRGSIHPFRSGDTILSQGDDGDSLVILLSGVAKVSMVSANGREIILDYAEAGAVLGEIAVLDGEPRTASVCATTAGRLLRLGRAAFQSFIESHPRLALRMMRDMARRLRQANDTIESDRAFSAGPRLARYLRRLTGAEGDAPADGRLRHDLSQSDLGSFVGISREHVNRQLSAWADAGVIQLEHGRIRILDSNYLSEVAAATG